MVYRVFPSVVVHDDDGVLMIGARRHPRARLYCKLQALDRTAPMLPSTPERATHDYQRAGTSSLYAALDIRTGQTRSATTGSQASKSIRPHNP